MEQLSVNAQYISWRESLTKGSDNLDISFAFPSSPDVQITDQSKAAALLKEGYLPPESPYDFSYSQLAYEGAEFDNKLNDKFGKGNWKALELDATGEKNTLHGVVIFVKGKK